MLLDLVLECGQSGIKVLPHGLDLTQVHGRTLHLLDHLVFLLHAFVDADDAFFFNTKLDCISMHFFDLLNALRIGIELLESFLDKLADHFSVFLN